MRWKHRYGDNMLLPLLALIFLSVRTIDACLCVFQHPQTYYCQSEFVAVLKVWRTVRVSPYEFAYKVKVNKIFKHPREGVFDLGYQNLYTPAEESMCGVTLTKNVTYIIGGRMISGKPHISLCNMVQVWSNLPSRQRKNFKEYYKRNCDCKILFTDWQKKGTTLDRAGNDSCLWESSPGPQDCQEKYGVCMRGPRGCSWAPSVSYKNCIKEYRSKRQREHQRPRDP